MRKLYQTKRIDHVNILKFITVNHDSNSLIIKFDNLCIYLMRHERRDFLVSQFEKLFLKETNKLEGYKINEVALNKICDYIDDLSAYLTVQKSKSKNGDLLSQMKTFQNSRPEEYRMVRDRYRADMEVAKSKNPKVYEKMLAKYKRRFSDDDK